MKRKVFLIIVCVIALSWGISHAGIGGTAHDLTPGGLGGFSFYGTVQVCVFCHTPHGARTDVSETTYWPKSGALTTGSGAGGFLLWNRALPSQSPGDSTVTGFEVYTSSTLDSQSDVLNVYSLLCMACHDGVGALNVVANYPGDVTEFFPNGPIPAPGIVNISDVFAPGANPPTPNIGELPDAGSMHLENDHPVSIDYQTAYNADGSSAFQSITPDGQGAHVGSESRVRLFPDPQGVGNWYVECPSCHNVHDNSNGHFLVMSNSGSALCTSCHIK